MKPHFVVTERRGEVPVRGTCSACPNEIFAPPVMGERSYNLALWKMNTEMLTYSRSKGAFAGLTLEGAVVQQDNDSTRAIYGKSMAFRAILSGKASTPKSAVPFMNALSEAGRQAHVAAKEERK